MFKKFVSRRNHLITAGWALAVLIAVGCLSANSLWPIRPEVSLTPGSTAHGVAKILPPSHDPAPTPSLFFHRDAMAQALPQMPSVPTTPPPVSNPETAVQPLPENPEGSQTVPPASRPDAGPQPSPQSAGGSPTPSPGSTPNAGLQALPQTPDISPSPTPSVDVAPTPTPVKHNPSTEPGDPSLNTSNSFWLDNYPLNDLYQYLARQANFQFFQNP